LSEEIESMGIFRPLLVALLTVAMTSCHSSVSSPPTHASSPGSDDRQIVLGEPGRFALGQLEAQSQSEYSFNLFNPTSEPLSFHVSTSCECASVEPATVSIGPGERQPITLVVDLLHDKNFRGVLLLRIQSDALPNESNVRAERWLSLLAELEVR
jgi:hypothetical protein